jgi:hypothetical protein
MENNEGKLDIPFHDEICEFTNFDYHSVISIIGLMDGISVLESNKLEQPALPSDILYNDKEPVDLNLQGLYYDEGITVSDYQVEDFGEAVTLLSTITMDEAIFGTGDTV